MNLFNPLYNGPDLFLSTKKKKKQVCDTFGLLSREGTVDPSCHAAVFSLSPPEISLQQYFDSIVPGKGP